MHEGSKLQEKNIGEMVQNIELADFFCGGRNILELKMNWILSS